MACCETRRTVRASCTPALHSSEIRATGSLLGEVERLSESIVRLEGAVSNLQQREASITQSANPPRFILKHYRKEFMAQVSVEVMPIGAEDPPAEERCGPTRTDDCEASRLHQGT